MNKKICVLIVCVIGIVLCFVFFSKPGMNLIRYVKAEKTYQMNQQKITNIVDYLLDDKFENVYINCNFDKGVMYTFTNINNSYIHIDNESVSDDIYYLFNSESFENIYKSDKTIFFQKWSNLDHGFGIMFNLSKDNQTAKDEYYIRALSQPGWYYYEN